MCGFSFSLANSNLGIKFMSSAGAPALGCGLGVVDHLLAHCRIPSTVKPHFMISSWIPSSDVERTDLNKVNWVMRDLSDECRCDYGGWLTL